MPKVYGTDRDWPAVDEASANAWTEATGSLFRDADRLERAIEAFTDDRLGARVPGRDYDFYRLFHGNVQHALYHGGQIALLKSAAKR